LRSLELFSTSNNAAATESSRALCEAKMLLCNFALNPYDMQALFVLFQALLDVENSSSDLKSELKELQISKVIEQTLTAKGKKEKRVLVVFVPVPLGKIV